MPETTYALEVVQVWKVRCSCGWSSYDQSTEQAASNLATAHQGMHRRSGDTERDA